MRQMEEEDNQDHFIMIPRGGTEEDEEGEEWSRPVDDPLLDSGKVQPGQHRSPVNKNPANFKLDHPRTIIQIDIDCFYAQVEMIHNPALRDIPLGIQQKYLVVTCNYPARAKGVTKLMGINEAKRKCPELVLVSGEDLTHYREMSYKISEFLMKYTPNVERLGFDENYLDVTEMVDQRIRGNTATPEVVGHQYSPPNDDSEPATVISCPCGCHYRLAVGSQIAADIRSALNIELGITCCAGIAHNKLLAKLVGGVHKPNQQTTIFPCHGLALVTGLDRAHCIPGVGWATKNRLKTMGVVSVTDLQRFPLSQLEEEFGVAMAATMRQLSFGVDDSPVVTYSRPQMLSVEDSFRCCSSEDDARSRISRLFTSLLPRVQEDGRTPHTLRLSVRKAGDENSSFHRESRQCNLPPSTATKILKGRLDAAKDQLVPMAMSLFHKMVDTTELCRLKLINVAFAKLEETANNNITAFFGTQGSVSPVSQLRLKSSEEGSSLGTKMAVGKGETVAAGSATQSIPKRKHPNSVASFFTKKQKVSGDRIVECIGTNNMSSPEPKAQNSLRSDNRNHEAEFAGTSENLILPPDVDPDVFAQLPSEIQQEILQRVRGPRMASSHAFSKPVTSAGVPPAQQNKRNTTSTTVKQLPAGDGFFSSQKKPIFSPPKSKECKSALSPDKSGVDTEGVRPSLNHASAVTRISLEEKSSVEEDLQNKKSLAAADCNSKSYPFPPRTVDGGTPSNSKASETEQIASRRDHSPGKSSETFASVPSFSPQVANKSGAKNLTNSTSSGVHSFTSSKLSVPKGVAPDVFSELPPEIQREIAAEIAIQKHNVASEESRSMQQSNNNKSPTKKVNSMLNYLRKK